MVSHATGNPCAVLTVTKSYGGLSIPSDSLFELLCRAEQHFRACASKHNFCTLSSPVDSLHANTDTLLASSQLPLCHNVGRLALHKFYCLRAYIWAKYVTSEEQTQFILQVVREHRKLFPPKTVRDVAAHIWNCDKTGLQEHFVQGRVGIAKTGLPCYQITCNENMEKTTILMFQRLRRLMFVCDYFQSKTTY